MTYWNNSNVQDVADAIRDAEEKAGELKQCPLEDVLDQVDAVLAAVSNIEDELRYVDSDIEDLEGFREFSELASAEGIEDEYDLREVIEERDELAEKVKELEASTADAAEIEKLQAENEHLQHWHDNQGMVIRALLDRLSQINGLVDSNSIGDLIFNATRQTGIVLITDGTGDEA